MAVDWVAESAWNGWPNGVEYAVGPGGEFVQGVLEPGGGVEPVELGGPQQALDHRRPLARPLRPGEQPVLLADGNRADGVLHRPATVTLKFSRRENYGVESRTRKPFICPAQTSTWGIHCRKGQGRG